MQNWQKRTALLIGEDGVGRLERARVAILGLGGVGSAAAEALCRAGVGHLLLIDHDTVDETNLNRQLVATRPVIGMPKTQAALLRLRAIRPDGDFMPAEQFYLPDNSTFLFEWQPDYGLARVIRRELRRRGIGRQAVVFSTEEPSKSVCPSEHGRHAPGSIAFVPPAAGMLMASRAVRDLLAL